MIWLAINLLFVIAGAWGNHYCYRRGIEVGFRHGYKDGLMLGEMRANNRVRASIYRD